VIDELWTLTCINWPRRERDVSPCVVAGQPKRRPTVSGVTRRSSSRFEHELAGVRKATEGARGSTTLVPSVTTTTLDRVSTTTMAGACYFVDAAGVIRDSYFGEGRY